MLITDSPGEAAPASLAGPFAIDLQDTDQIGISAEAGGLRLDGSLRNVGAYAPFERAGILTTRPFDAGSPVAAAITSVEADVPEGTGLQVEVRGSSNGVEWTSWHTPGTDWGVIFAWPVRFVQHRLTLLGDDGSPELAGLTLSFRPTTSQARALQARTNPTVKVFASREGLIGRATANGHTIEASDRFVALPSKRVLNPRGKQDYRVRVSYQNRTVEAPVWDVGPWNTRDNYWDQDRETFTDLPRFVPQAYAAWADNHNGGRDLSGRWVSFPSALDISDALFVDELKMRTSSWVDVTFLWVDAASPPPGPTPPVTGLKPQESKGMQSPGARAEATRPPPTGTTVPEPTRAPTNTPERPVEAQPTDSESTRATSTTTPERPSPSPSPSAEPTPSPTNAESEEAADAESVIAASPNASEGGAELRAAVVQGPRPYTLQVARVPVGDGFGSRIALFNPDDRAGEVTMLFVRPDGQRESRRLTIAGQARTTFTADDQLPPGDYSVQIESDRLVLAERTTLFGDDGITQAAVSDPARQWYFPEGSTEAPSETTLALRNVGQTDARATLTFISDRGQVDTAEVDLARGARTVVNLMELLPPVPISTVVESDQPILAERLTLRNGRAGGDGGAGASMASSTWYFADACTADGVDAWLVLLNPGTAEATVRARLYSEHGPVGEREYRLQAGTRRPIHLNEDVPDGRFALVLSADQPIVAERTEFVGPGPSPDGMSSMIGATELGTSWAFPEGLAGGETISILNPGEALGTARVEVFGERGRLSSREVRLSGESRAVIDIDDDAPGSAVSVRITADRPIVAEREIRLSDGRGETASLGIRLP